MAREWKISKVGKALVLDDRNKEAQEGEEWQVGSNTGTRNRGFGPLWGTEVTHLQKS